MKSKLKLIFLFLLIMSVSSFAQKKKAIKYFEENTIDLTKKSNQQKFELISNQIGDTRVLLLGEQDHGDGTTMTFKSELVKYLHKEKGFDLILFESDFFLPQQQLEKGSTNIDEALKYIYPIYTNCEQCTGLFSYIDSTYKTDNPLLMSGFDMQKYYYMPEYIQGLKAEIKDRGIVIEDTSWFYNSISERPNEELDKLISYVKTIDPNDNTLFSQEMVSLERYLQLEKKKQVKRAKPSEFLSIRDSAMAENALWLIQEKYPDKKVIVWGHSSHLSRYKGSKYYYMGSGLHEALGDEMYSIAFTAYEGSGSYAIGNLEHDKKTIKSSYENWNYENGYSTSFINLKGLRGKDVAFVMKGLFTNSNLKLKWDTIFDGVIYLQTVEPCIKVKEI